MTELDWILIGVFGAGLLAGILLSLLTDTFRKEK
jgi:hypothetical protein